MGRPIPHDPAANVVDSNGMAVVQCYLIPPPAYLGCAIIPSMNVEPLNRRVLLEEMSSLVEDHREKLVAARASLLAKEMAERHGTPWESLSVAHKERYVEKCIGIVMRELEELGRI